MGLEGGALAGVFDHRAGDVGAHAAEEHAGAEEADGAGAAVEGVDGVGVEVGDAGDVDDDGVGLAGDDTFGEGLEQALCAWWVDLAEEGDDEGAGVDGDERGGESSAIRLAWARTSSSLRRRAVMSVKVETTSTTAPSGPSLGMAVTSSQRRSSLPR